LKGNKGGLDASQLGCLRIIRGEGNGDTWVVHNKTGSNICVEAIDEYVPVRRAGARDFDAVDTITITGSSWVHTRSNSEIWHKSRVNTRGLASYRCILNSSLLSKESSRSSRATNSGSVQILKGNKCSLDASQLGCLRIIRGEGYANTGVIYDPSSIDVSIEASKEDSPVRGARARDFDAVNTIAITGSSWVQTGFKTEFGNESRVNVTLDWTS